MNSLSKNIKNIRIVSYFLIIQGTLSLLQIYNEFRQGNFYFDVGVLALYVGYLLLNFYAISRIIALYYISFYFIISLVSLTIILNSVKFSLVSIDFNQQFLIICFVIGILYYSIRTLINPSIKDIFEGNLSSFIEVDKLPSNVNCMNCGIELELDPKEQEEKIFNWRNGSWPGFD